MNKIIAVRHVRWVAAGLFLCIAHLCLAWRNGDWAWTDSSGRTWWFKYKSPFDGTVNITDVEHYSGSAKIEGVVTIPSVAFHEGSSYPVYGIECGIKGDKLTGVIIAHGIKRIGNGVFSGNNFLTRVTIPDSVTSIGECAFANLGVNFKSVTIPNSVTTIEGGAFLNCIGLTNITIPGSVKEWGVSGASAGAFEGCTGLTSVTIPASVTSIGRGAFRNCSSLTSVTIPASVTSIGGGAFDGCSGLTSVTIPASVTSIGGSAFDGCSGLTNVKIPDSVTSIGERAFNKCSGLTDITIPNSVTSIGYWAFRSCNRLTYVTVPASVREIGAYAFGNCPNLTKAILPTWCKGKVAYWVGDVEYFERPAWTKNYTTEDIVRYVFERDNVQVVYKDVKGNYGSGSDEDSGGGHGIISVPVGETAMFERAQTVLGALYEAQNDTLVGTVELKIGKRGKKGVKVSGTVTMMLDGKVKKLAAKAVNMPISERGLSGALVFKAPVGSMEFSVDVKSDATLRNANYRMVVSDVGGKLQDGTKYFNVDVWPVPDFGADWYLLEDTLPYDVPISVSANRWYFGKAPSPKYKKDRVTGEYDLVGLYDYTKPNVSGLKLTYTAKTGLFKGTFRMYVTNEYVTPNGKAPKLKKYTVNVMGFVINGEGEGQAVLKKPVVVWPVTID